MDIQKLIEKRAELWENAKNFLNEHTDNDGKISAEDAATYDKMEKDLSDLSKNIERFQRQAAMDLQLAQPTTKPILNNPQDNTFLATKNNGDKRASNEYREAAITALRTNFKNVNNVMQKSVGSGGGYLVPTEWDSSLITILKEENVFRQLAKTMTTLGEYKFNIPNDDDDAFLVDEGQPIPEHTPTLKQKSLSAYKIAKSVKVSNELLEDSAFDIESFILDSAGKALARKEEDFFINGKGNNQPTGILTTATDNSNMTLTTAGANLAPDDILELVSKLPRSYRKNAAFLINDATLASIRKFKDANQAYIWQPNYQAGEPDRLLGYPVYSSIYMPTIAAGAQILAFGDFSSYYIGDRGTRTFQQLNELYAPNFMTGYIMVERVDGVLADDNAVRVLQVKS